MNGPEIFIFTVNRIPPLVHQLFEKSGFTESDIDFFVFHQANLYILEHLRKKLNISESKMLIFIAKCGNTSSSTIPIAIAHGLETGILKSGMRLMLIGFGVGYSWGATIITI
jgi:3-oxoacyl-[acyl-carrier-protein] synthase-3